MAKVTLNPMFQRLSGGIGRIVHYNRYGRQYCRIHVNPANPRTECQQAVRGTFADAVRSWQQLTHTEQSGYNRKARYKTMTGYNLYISLFMKANMPTAKRIPAAAGSQIVFSSCTDSIQPASSSVAVPFMPAVSSYSSSTGLVCSPAAGS